MSEQLRAYCFNNFYLQGIHAGIQSAHSLMEMAVKYKGDVFSSAYTPSVMFSQWAENHKTIIVLNGGMQSDLENLIALLDRDECTLPWDAFYEEKAALNGALTNVGVIVPERIFDPVVAKKEEDSEYGFIGESYFPNLTPWELEFHTLMKKCPLMR